MRIPLLLLMFILCTSAFAKRQGGATESDVAATGSNRIALVIGNNNYFDKNHCPTLKVCRNDADSMSAVLRKSGFKVICIKDQERREILAAINNFVGQLPDYDVALVYYSGHGTEMDGNNYILPTDVVIPSNRNEVSTLMFKNSAVDIKTTILSEFAKRQDKSNFLILDACRINIDDFLPGSKGPGHSNSEEGFSKSDKYPGTMIAFATGVRQKSFESKGSNSVFTSELLKQIVTPNLTYKEVFARAAKNTVELISQNPNDFTGLQQPQIMDMISGKFVFVSDNSGDTKTATMPSFMVTASYSAEDLTRVQMADRKYGYEDRRKKIVIPGRYQYADEVFHEGLAVVKYNNRFGFIDKNGDGVIPTTYDKAYSFSGGIALVQDDGLFGYIDKKGGIAIPFQFKAAGSIKEGLAWVNKDGKYGYIDNAGRLVIDYQFEEAGAFSDGLAVVKKNGKWGYIDKDGGTAIDFQYESCQAFSEGLAKVTGGCMIMYINKAGAVIKQTYMENCW